MSNIQLYLLEVDKDKPEARHIAARSAIKLENKQLKLIDLITTLEPYINNKDDGSLRGKSVAYLADVLESLPPKVLSGQERRLLCDFILGRVEGDVQGIGASARALLALEARGKWDSETSQKVMRTFLGETHPLRQFKLQTDRLAVIQLFDLLIAKYRSPMQRLQEGDPDFLSSFNSYFEGEKDPRNLMIIFSILHVPMTEWDIQANAHELFESVFNYFPITFKPPPDDPYGITAQDLKNRLRDNVAASSDFAPYAFPALLDKLDSTSMNTKRDVLQTIQACVDGYEAKTINLYSVTLWDALKFEILNVQEEDLAEEALIALSSLGAKLAQSEGPLNSYLRPVIKECNEHLEDAPTKQSQAAGRILQAVAGSDITVADKISKGVCPVLFSLYQASESITKRRGLLEVFNEIIRAYVHLTSSKTGVSTDRLAESTADAVGIMLRALANAPKAEVSFRLTALRGLALLLAVPRLVSSEEVDQIVDAVTNVILRESTHGHGDIRVEAVKTLVEMAHAAPSAIQSRAIPAFMVELPDVSPNDGSVTAVLEAFVQLSSELQVFDTVVLRLKNKLNAARTHGASKAYQQALLLALLYAFTHGAPMPGEDGATMRSSYFTEYADPLISALKDEPRLDHDGQVLEVIGRICNVILRHQGVHFQSTVYNKHLSWLTPAGSDAHTPSDHSSRLAPFLLYYYAALRPEVVDAADIVALLQTQARQVLHEQQAATETGIALRFLSLLINKFIEPKAMRPTLESADIEVESLLTDGQNAQAVGVVFAVVKALLVQGKSPTLTSSYLQLLLRLLGSAEKGVARHFTQLLAPDDILTKENHCVVSGLYKQKALNQTVPSIVEALRTADASKKPNYLIALAGILRWLPYSMIEASLPSLMAPLLQTLDLNEPADQEVKAPTLTIFESVLMHDSTVVAEHTASLITRLLNCTAGSANTAKVRAKSLQCLALVPRQLKREAVVPYRRQVVKKLMACLDDPKRDVRAQAVRCRTAWLGLDEDEDRDD